MSKQPSKREIDELARNGSEELREYLQSGGRLWDTTALQIDFEVHGFSAPFVEVTRKRDGQHGSLRFVHYPRWYYGFKHN